MTEAAGSTAGGLLRAAREKQGLHIAALAAAIKVSPRKLDALENDRLAELPDATFTRALAQTVCRQLKIDAKPVLDLLPVVGGAALERARVGLNTPFRERPGRADPGLAFAAIRPMVWAASLLMLAAVVVYFLPEGLFDRAAAPTTVSTPLATTPPASAAATAPVASAPPVVAAVASPTAVAGSAAAVAGSAASEPTTGAAPLVAAAPVVETVFAAPPAASAVAGLVQLRTSEASWIEARDGAGQLLLSRTVQLGESVGLDGKLPIRLTIGNASATQLSFRGQAVDLRPRTRDNIARVELQ
ncbi:MAG TPA: helix-turn-helix domain-containing protein [Rubrivivax sp.]|jgi:cytoskeleton protein RodZ|nr:helix-turn-helix domain-containing protein [Rubrivivax sp.]